MSLPAFLDDEWGAATRIYREISDELLRLPLSSRVKVDEPIEPFPVRVRSVYALMPTLTDRQRIELAIPAYLLYALTGAPDVFVPADPELAARAEADIAQLRADLRTACLEPFADLAPAKRQALIRRLERVKRLATTDWHERPALDLMLMLWCFLKDLTDREILILWEGSVMDRAIRKLMPMCEHGFENQEDCIAAEVRARGLLDRLRAEGLYR